MSEKNLDEKICISMFVEDVTENLEQISSGCGIELRCDTSLPTSEIVEKLKQNCSFIIATWKRQENSKIALVDVFAFVKKHNLDYLDIDSEYAGELSREVLDSFKSCSTKLIFSYHNYEKTPALAELRMIAINLFSGGADVVKIVGTANYLKDNLEILSLYKAVDFPLIAFCMGESGKISRLTALLYGSPFMYCSFNSSLKTAVGQYTVEEFRRLLAKFNL